MNHDLPELGLTPQEAATQFNQLQRVDEARLPGRAEECVMALFQIESELFAFEITDGKMVPKHQAYWPKLDEDGWLAISNAANSLDRAREASRQPRSSRLQSRVLRESLLRI